MPKVLFTRRVEVPDGPIFEEGVVYDLPDASVGHWLARDAVSTDGDKIAEAEARSKPQTKPAPKKVNLAAKAVVSPALVDDASKVESPTVEEPKAW